MAQFTFGCSSTSQMWVPIVAGSSDHIIRFDPLATLNTQLRTDCFACIDPGQSPTPVDSITHCFGKVMYMLEMSNVLHNTTD